MHIPNGCEQINYILLMEEIHTLIPGRIKTQDSTVNYKTSDMNK
jgi:hypothetical protein